MFKKNNIIILINKFKLYKIFIKNNLINIFGPLGFLQKKLPFYLENKKFIFYINKNKINSFLSYLNKMIIGVNQGWFFILNIFGRGLSFKILKNKILKIKIGFSHFINIFLNYDILIKRTKKPQKILLYSLDYWSLSKLIYKLRNLRKDNNYKIQNIKFYNEDIKLKPGKEKQF